MLCLSRHLNESIVINGNITVTVIAIRGSKIRLGISAPSEVSVHRREFHDDMVRRGEIGSDGRPVSLADLGSSQGQGEGQTRVPLRRPSERAALRRMMGKRTPRY